MTQESALGILAALIFVILGIVLMVGYKKLTSRKYFQILVFFIGIMMLGFGIYMAIAGFYWNE